MSANENEARLRDFVAAAHAPGALDAKTKELIHIALLLHMRCETLAASHLATARALGITDAELEETAQLVAAVAAGVVVATAKRARKMAEMESAWLRDQGGKA